MESLMLIVSNDKELGEFQVAEYIVFLLALDTYMRYAEETGGIEDVEDDIIQDGLRILRLADTNIENIKAFLAENLPTQTHKIMLERAMFLNAYKAAGATKRAFLLRTLLSRGGPVTIRAIFTGAKYLRAVRESISASMLEDADKALDIFAAIPMQNARMRNWIDEAAKQAGTGQAAPVATDNATTEAAEVTQALLVSNVAVATASTENVLEATKAKSDILQNVEIKATEAAKKSLAVSQQEDLPLTRSEVVGVATAVAAATMGDSSNPQNIPESLRNLDDEQRAAALTDGKVVVAAGAGSGKTTTVAARVSYLVKDRRVFPSRILVTSFNTKAAGELKERIGRFVGGEALQQMSVGTMHSLFKRFITEYGTAQERTMMSNGFVGDGSAVARTVQKIWEDCYGTKRKVPKLKDAKMAASKWAGNNVSPEEAVASATDPGTLAQAHWFEMYEGVKGSTPGWKPPCPSKSYESFMGRYRPNNIRLGDFTDMLKVFRELLIREPAVLSTVQKVYDHIIVDEAQDRNTLMRDCLDMIAGQVTDGSDGKSYWVVGDSNQAINSFQGAKSELFMELYNTPGWKVRAIQTNYRCEPEVVDAANRLISYNEDGVPVASRANPAKVRGIGSIKVDSYDDEADSALSTVEGIKQNLVLGGNLSDHSILTRTNREIHAFETACIIRGIPYARKGASSFFGSPETSAMLGYVQLVTGTDYSKMQAALGQAINKPNRFFLSDPKKAPEAVAKVFSDFAYYEGVDVKDLNPLEVLQKPKFVSALAKALAALTRTGKGFKFEDKIYDLANDLSYMKAKSSTPDYSTKDLFDDILDLKGTGIVGGSFVDQTFRESLQAEIRDRLDEDVEEDEEDDSQLPVEGGTDKATKGLGNISFLYQLALPDPTDEDDAITPPTNPLGFKAKMERYASKMRDLRTDLTAYYKAQEALPPEKRTPPPGVYLGTVHSTKGAQWPNVTVSMPKGKFPMDPPKRLGDKEPQDSEELSQRIKDERRLAYVAITRAAKTLNIVCPKSVAGKTAGISPFVYEAGLREGENVTKNPPEETTKQASFAVWEDS